MDVQPIFSPNLKIIFPSVRNLAIENFQTKVEGIIKKVRIDADRTGTATPVIILFSETSLKYVFNINPNKIHQAITNIQQKMPSDIDIAVGFSVFEHMSGLSQNRGYLFTAKERRTSFKRRCTYFDVKALSYAGLSKYERVWLDKGSEMEGKGKKFASIQLNNNLRVELRVCFDVKAEPIVPKTTTLTIVPAHNLDPRSASRLSSNRQKVVINDSGKSWSEEALVTHFNTMYRNTCHTPSEIEV